MTPEGQRFASFCSTYLKHTRSIWAGQPFLLEGWQRDWASELLRTEDGQRVYQQALLGISRGNGKSTLLSALCLYALLVEGIEERGAEVYAVAGSRDQARIIFAESRRMIEASPLFDFVKVYRDVISVPQTEALFRVLSSDAPKTHGLSPWFYVGDEIHGWEDEEQWHALSTAQIKRKGSLGVGISTAGFTLDSLLGELYERGQKDEEGFFFKWFEASKPDDPATWKEANPSPWITQEDLEREARRHPVAVFRRLHLNKWTSAEQAWLPAGVWEGCKSDLDIELEDEIYVGVDLGVARDSTAIVWVAPKDGRLVARSRILVPEDGERVEFSEIEETLRELARDYTVMEIAYDPWGMRRSAELLEDEGLPMVEFPQSNPRMIPASMKLFDVIVDGILAHDGDPLLAKHVDAAAIKQVGSHYRLDKKKGRNHMDGAISLAIACDRAMANEGGGFEVRFVDVA